MSKSAIKPVPAPVAMPAALAQRASVRIVIVGHVVAIGASLAAAISVPAGA